MEILGIAIGVIGILLTVIFSDVVIGVISSRYRACRARFKWSADRQVNEGEISRLDHYAFARWHQVIAVDGHGNSTHTIDARVVNRGKGLLKAVTFPIYGDCPNVPETALAPWARVRRRNLHVKVVDYISSRSRGRILVPFTPPVLPGHELKFHWGYTMPHTFQEGDEYYNYDAANEFNELILELRFSSEWTILYARWGEDFGLTQRPPIVKGNTLTWRACFPGFGKRVEMKFGLSRTTEFERTPEGHP